MKKHEIKDMPATTRQKVSAGPTGVAGVYAAALEMSRRDLTVSITSRNAKGVDLLATRKDATKVVAIQVKTNRNREKHWVLGASDETYHAKELYYVFVNFPAVDSEPVFFIYKSATVAKRISESHAAWLAKPGKSGQERKPNGVRRFTISKEEKPGQWHLLGIGGRVR